MGKLVNRTTDDRLDDLLEAVEKQTAATNRASMQMAESLGKIEAKLGKIRASVWLISLLVVLDFIGGIYLLLIAPR